MCIAPFAVRTRVTRLSYRKEVLAFPLIGRERGCDDARIPKAPRVAYAPPAGLYAVDNNSGTGTSTSCTSSSKDKHRYSNYGFSIPGGATIQGIEVRLNARVDRTSGAPAICVPLSWDGGTTWTTAKPTTTLATAETTRTLGGVSDTWGRTWSSGDFSDANFHVRLIDVASSTSRDFSLDWVAVRARYLP